MRGALAVSLVALEPPAFAGSGTNLNVECDMTEPCAGSGGELAVDPSTTRLAGEPATITCAGECREE